MTSKTKGSAAPPAGEGTTVILENQALPVIEALVKAFQAGNAEALEHALAQLGAASDSDLYRKVGEMTRALHESLGEFQKSMDPSSTTMHSTSLPDATNKLEDVIRMTTEAAHRTLSLTERQTELLAQDAEKVRELHTVLQSSAVSSAVKEQWVKNYLEHHTAVTTELQSISNELTMTQGFQDLSGQALRKVIKLVTELETSLVSLVRIFGEPPAASAVPAADAEKKGSLEQGDVDSILSSFGF